MATAEHRRPSRRHADEPVAGSGPRSSSASSCSRRSRRRRRALLRPRRPGRRRGARRRARARGSTAGTSARPIARDGGPARALRRAHVAAAAAAAADGGPAGRVGRTSSRWLIGCPLAGAVAVLFMPRQAPRLLRGDDARRDARRRSPRRSRSCACRWAAATTSTRTSSGCRASASTTTSRSTASRSGSSCSRRSSRPSRRTRRSARSKTRIKDWCFALLLLEGGDARRVRRARSLPLLRLLGADARPDVRHDRRLGRDQPHQERDQVLPLHDVRLGADARRHPVPRVHVRARSTAARRASTTSRCSALLLPRHVQLWLWARSRSPSSSRCRCSRCTRGCRTRTRRRRRRARSSSPPSCSRSAPTGTCASAMGLFPEASRGVRGEPRRRRRARRHHLRRALRVEAGRREAPHRVLVGRAPRLRDARPLRGDAGVARGRRPADGQPRHLDRRALPPRRRHLRPPPHAPASTSSAASPR